MAQNLKRVRGANKPVFGRLRNEIAAPFGANERWCSMSTMALADGCIAGTALKLGDDTWNPVDPEQAADFMARAGAARGG